MLNRRHLRIKVLQFLYAHFQSSGSDIKIIEKELVKSIESIYDLYLLLLQTFGELKFIAENKIEKNKNKKIPTDDDLNPNRKFVDNSMLLILENIVDLRKFSEKRKLNWLGEENQEMFRKMYRSLRESEVYFNHLNNGQIGFEEDKAFIIALFKSEIANFEGLIHFFEEESIHWMDDIDLACAMVVKTLKNFNEGEEGKILNLYKDKEDEMKFVIQLLKKTVSFDKENEILIDELTQNWELDRIAKMDIILMKMAITELQVFENIPSKVTLNEYIEISKFYSTPKSNGFINGVLDKAIGKLEEEGKMKKKGRGLIN